MTNGSRRRKGGVVVVRAPGREGSARVGLVVPKDGGDAVTRNRIRRRLRHALTGLQLEPGNDYVIIGRRQVVEASYDQLVDWLRDALEESGS